MSVVTTERKGKKGRGTEREGKEKGRRGKGRTGHGNTHNTRTNIHIGSGFQHMMRNGSKKETATTKKKTMCAIRDDDNV